MRESGTLGRVDATSTLESIAKLLPTLPEEAVESLLVTFDALVGVSDPQCRPLAAGFLQGAAALCTGRPLSQRLLRASEMVLAGQPCALTPEGLSWKQAAAAQTISAEEWEKRKAELPPPPSSPLPEDADDEEEESDEESDEGED